MKSISSWIIGCSLLFAASSGFSQDLTYFVVVDNATVGLTVAPFSKGGLALSDIDRNG